MTTDEETAEEIHEALGHLTHTAKRCVTVIGNADLPTKWDKVHQQIDAMLDALDLKAVPA
jgi:hypothetical protein